jgi:tetratricopeptide (TPR) repeat protein
MTLPLNSAIVRIRSTNNNVIGTGFLVTKRHIITCVHIIQTALGKEKDLSENSQTRISLDFPLVQPELWLNAEIVHWRPEHDIAGLQLTNELPEDASTAPLVRGGDLWDHSFRTFGFPEGYANGVWASGKIRSKEATGWLQVEGNIPAGYPIQPGFSGAPVWDERLHGIIGMVVTVDTRPISRAAFLIPSDVLAQKWPEVIAEALLEVDMKRLKAKHAELREPLRIIDRQRIVNLPPLDVTRSFKDRLPELREFCEYVSNPDVRLISIVGRGGIGKTALAVRILSDLSQGKLKIPSNEKLLTSDGILYLGARRQGLDLEQIYMGVKRMLGHQDARELSTQWIDRNISLESKIEYLLETMQNGEYFILLDNLEDYLTREGNIADKGLQVFFNKCLGQPHGVRLIVTSRQEVRLAPSHLRKARHISLLKGLPEDDAVALLRELDPQGRSEIRDAPDEELLSAVRLTKGIPRALELIAGILDQDKSINLRRLLEKKRFLEEEVVEQLVAEGYQHLEKDERRVMEALAIFDRPVSETAIFYLLHPWFPGMNVKPCLNRLVDSYFAAVDRSTGKYSLHPLDQTYAYRRLPPDLMPNIYSRDNLELRAAEYYASIRKPENEWLSIDDLRPQLAEFKHRVRAGDYSVAFHVLNSIDFKYLFLWGHQDLLRRMRESLLEKLADSRSKMRNLGRLGHLHRCMGQEKEAIPFFTQALSFARQLGDPVEESKQLVSLGFAYYAFREVNRAIEFYEESLEIAHRIGDRNREIVVLDPLGLAYRVLGKIDEAVVCHNKVLDYAREVGLRRREGYQIGNLGRAYRALGETERAIEHFQEAKIIMREISDRRGESIWLGHLGRAFYASGQIEKATDFYNQALSIDREIGDKKRESVHLVGLGEVLIASDEIAEARHCLERALKWDKKGIRFLVALMLGVTLLHQEDPNMCDFFIKADVYCQELLEGTPQLYEARYGRALALVGQAICSPTWSNDQNRARLLSPAINEYRKALKNCSAPGVVQDALRALYLILKKDVQDWDSVFSMLESALNSKKD